MFYYYGGKAQRAKHYPPPEYPTIVEPFAGAAGYSMHHLRAHRSLLTPEVERVILVEKNPRVAEVWQRLLAMSPGEILSIPVPEVGQVTDDFLIMCAMASNSSAGSRTVTVTDRGAEKVPPMLRRAAKMAEHRHKVEVIVGNYADAPDLEATWFIDPPYDTTPSTVGHSSTRGGGYGRGFDAAALDFSALGEWCRSRRGQVIACEMEGADWLPFRYAYENNNTVGTRLGAEVIWTN